MRRPRGYKKLESQAIGLIIVIGIVGSILGFVFEVLNGIWSTNTGKITLLSIAGFILIGLVLKIKSKIKAEKLRQEQIQLLKRQIDSVKISTDRSDYIIESDDYKRGNPKENLYRKQFLLNLLKIYNNSCAKCQSTENGIDVDHFFMSKNEGGCFIMRHNEGYLVNNALPLCRSCNRSKSDSSYEVFFSDEELLKIFNKNVELTRLINERSPLDAAGIVIKASKRKAAA